MEKMMKEQSSFIGEFQQKTNVLSDFEHAKSLIIERVRQLLGQLFEKGRHEEPPFKPEELAQLLDIQKIVKTDLGKTNAMLLKSYNGFVIKLNKYHIASRQNFSFAHEIGHILFSELNLEKYIESTEYRTFNPQRNQNNRALLKEKLCDIASAELLMPKPIFTKYLSNYGISLQTVEQLADIFEVSPQSSAIRMTELSSKACLALLWKPLPINHPTGLRMAWRTGMGINARNKINYMPKNTNVKPKTIIYKAYEFKASTYTKIKFNINNKDNWLPIESKGFGHGDSRYVLSLAYP